MNRSMCRFIRCCLFAGVLAGGLSAEVPGRPPAEAPPTPAFVAVEDVAGLPCVLLIGDSISIGYTLPVRAALAGRANVHRPPENCGATASGLRGLDDWLGAGHWDVIHFNFGLHDLKYLDAQGKYVPPEQGTQVASPAQYEANLRALVARLQRTGAKLIFATTTPVPAGTIGRVEHDELAYNEVARRVMRETGVAIDDLHAAIEPYQAEWQQPQNVHFTPEGYAKLGETVAASIAATLPVPTAKADSRPAL